MITLTYDANYNLTDNTTLKYKLGGSEETSFTTSIDKTNVWKYSDNETKTNLDKGLYSLKEVKTADSQTTFDIPNNSFFCYTKCCLYSNKTETIYINKDDEDKKAFILNLFGSNCDDYSKPNKIKLVSSEQNKTIEDNCTVINNNKTVYYYKCNLTELEIKGGSDEDKPISYKVHFIPNGCGDTSYIETHITVNVVSSSYIKLYRISFFFLLMILL